MTAKLSLRGVVVRRAGIDTLAVDSLDLNDGEVLAVLGPNGAGKTTLLQTLGLLERPDRGDVFFEGISARGRGLALRRRMAVVFQEPLLLNRSVASNVALGLRLRGVSRRIASERAQRWLERFGITHLGGRSARRLSGGEAQRVSLARAFALEPEVILLDEPFSSLDQPTRETLASDLAGVLSETRTTTLFVTHDRDEAARLANRVAVLSAGRILQIGPVDEVYSAPADDTVAAYVGVETVVPARVLSVVDGVATLGVGSAEVEAAVQALEGTNVLLCLRPEDVLLSTDRLTASARNHLAGTVRSITLTGPTVRVAIDCGFRLVANVTRRSLEELAISEGSRVVASFKATAIHLIPRGG